jgi:exodeoxyribonuclease V alpha subunit
MTTDKSSNRLKNQLIRGDIRAIDFAFSEFISNQYQQESQALSDIAAHLSAQSGLQHVCVSIGDMQFALSDSFHDIEALKTFARESAAILFLPNSSNCIEDTQNYPIIFQGDAFYLQRYWVYETQLISHLSRLTAVSSAAEVNMIQPILNELFPPKLETCQDIDWQKIAVAVAALNPVTFITGGPGTGKTTTVVKLIALLRELAKQQEKAQMTIKLAAPTGKAAARLSESIASAANNLPAHLSEGLDMRCTTLHRLLGTNYQSIHFSHNDQNPLHADLIVLDEASMIDLPMMSKFFAAVPAHCQVVLLGDSEQLASVEVGTVLNDICALSPKELPSAGFIRILAQVTQYDISQLKLGYADRREFIDTPERSNLVNGIARLHKSHRFDAKSEIGQVARAVQMKDVTRAIGLLERRSLASLHWVQDDDLQNLVEDVLPVLIEYCDEVASGDFKQAFKLLKKQQVLCSHKLGRWGVENINRRLELELAKRSLLTLDSGMYQARPIMIARNSPAQNLFNGDIGIVAQDPLNKDLLKAWFETNDGEFRGILMNQLPEHDTVFAMTVHKSQGSEFEKVILCLPHERGRLGYLTRSLLYTGLTRSKAKISIFASKEALKAAILTDVKRGSGLTDRLSICN